ncbi:MAG TPA: hypothetical protein VMI47_03620 [Pseudolabrys sp.]|nr:hypothetical protein [Pseudolabrys sp.]
MNRLVRIVAPLVPLLLAAAVAAAQSFDGAYRGTLNCAKLSWTKAPLADEPVSVTIRIGKVSYSRVLYGVDRNQVVGQESGSGTVAADGSIVLNGRSAGALGTMTATYRGRLANGSAILDGRQSVTYRGKTEARACTLLFGR